MLSLELYMTPSQVTGSRGKPQACPSTIGSSQSLAERRSLQPGSFPREREDGDAEHEYLVSPLKLF